MPNAGDIIRASDVAVQACRVNRTVAQSLTDNTLTTIAFDDELFDTDGMHDTVTNNSRITINTAGFYTVGFVGVIAANSDYSRTETYLRINGSTVIAFNLKDGTDLGSQSQTLAVSTVYEFVVGDYIEVRVLQDNSSSAARDLEATGDQSPHFYAARIGS